jgi:hypothetical protein
VARGYGVVGGPGTGESDKVILEPMPLTADAMDRRRLIVAVSGWDGGAEMIWRRSLIAYPFRRRHSLLFQSIRFLCLLFRGLCFAVPLMLRFCCSIVSIIRSCNLIPEPELVGPRLCDVYSP